VIFKNVFSALQASNVRIVVNEGLYRIFKEGVTIYRVTIKEIDTFNVIKTVSVVDIQFAY
jgi:hypothetical protein